jgi:hypothetical protein
MGGDCCGTGTVAEAAVQQAVADLQIGAGKGKAKGGAVEDKDHKKHAEELKAFIQKRIQLFEEYKKREDDQVSGQLFQGLVHAWQWTGPVTLEMKVLCSKP